MKTLGDKVINVLIKKVDTDYLDNNYDRLLEELYPMRKEAVGKFNNRKSAYVSMTAGFLLMKAYDRIYGDDSRNIVIKKSEHGKPYIEGKEDFKFNISHSGDYVVIAYTVSKDINAIGIDIEKIRSRDDDMKIANRFFSKSEIDYISDGLECSDIDARFYKVWTMKEAYIKLTGRGLSQRLDSFSVNPDELSVMSLDMASNDVSFELKVIAGYVVTVCISGTPKKEINYEYM